MEREKSLVLKERKEDLENYCNTKTIYIKRKREM